MVSLNGLRFVGPRWKSQIIPIWSHQGFPNSVSWYLGLLDLFMDDKWQQILTYRLHLQTSYGTPLSALGLALTLNYADLESTQIPWQGTLAAKSFSADIWRSNLLPLHLGCTWLRISICRLQCANKKSIKNDVPRLRESRIWPALRISRDFINLEVLALQQNVRSTT